MSSRADFAVPQAAISRCDIEPRQRNAANGGGEPPSSPISTSLIVPTSSPGKQAASAMFKSWMAERREANLTMTEVLYAKAGIAHHADESKITLAKL